MAALGGISFDAIEENASKVAKSWDLVGVRIDSVPASPYRPQYPRRCHLAGIQVHFPAPRPTYDLLDPDW